MRKPRYDDSHGVIPNNGIHLAYLELKFAIFRCEIICNLLCTYVNAYYTYSLPKYAYVD